MLLFCGSWEVAANFCLGICVYAKKFSYLCNVKD
nr:MAG TPA: RK-1-like defensin [Herelleviridae sp.]